MILLSLWWDMCYDLKLLIAAPNENPDHIPPLDYEKHSVVVETFGKGLMSIIDAKDEGDIDSFFGGGQNTFLSSGFSGLDDFELICFMVVI